MRVMIKLCVLIGLALLSYAQAEGETDSSDTPPIRIPEISGPVYQVVRSIPYPSRSVYVAKGILGGIGFGKTQNIADTGSLFLWQGEMSYFYKPYFSAGLGGKIAAGEPSNSVQVVQNRYFIFGRFHLNGSQFAAFLGPQIGLDNLNIFNGKTDTALHNSDLDQSTDLGLGLQSGFGWKFSRWAGLTGGGSLEYTTGDQTLNLLFNPGLAIDILSFFNKMREQVPACYFFSEYEFRYLSLAKPGHRDVRAFIFGLGVAF